MELPAEAKKAMSLVVDDKVILCAGGFIFGRQTSFFEVARSQRLVPYVYEGANASVRRSSLDRELREDFYRSKLRVVFLDVEADGALASNWALAELPCVETGSFLICGDRQITSEDVDKLLSEEVERNRKAVAKLDLPSKLILAPTLDEFLQDLPQRFSALLNDE